MKALIKVKLSAITLLIITFIIISCGTSNKIYQSWVNPGATLESLKFKKVAVFGLVMKNSTRRIIEDEISKKFTNIIAIPAHKIINDNDLDKPELIKNKLIEDGFDGALVLRLINVENRKSYSPGVYPNIYYSFVGYYGYSWGYMYDLGGSYRTDQIVTAEVNIYSIRDEKLIWSGETLTMNPNNIENIIFELSESVKKQLAKDGLIENKTD